ncbi:MAG: hypothetical protein JSV75_02690 [Candidatus Bathyarchaeota archaeon]|nr:MAG: hypothetical protein JSV75_02690 [Candidatus Bathyarchaeota archaeon]
MRTEEIGMPGQARSVTLPKKFADWVDEKVKTRICASRRYALEVLILKEMRKQ